LIAALDRGLLGEYRAWSVTLALYLEGLHAGLWQSIADYEDWLGMRKPGENLRAVVMRRLDPGFSDPNPTDPESGIFGLALVQNELKWVRADLRVHLQPLYNLSVFLSDDQ
jgi:hypothetical protein